MLKQLRMVYNLLHHHRVIVIYGVVIDFQRSLWFVTEKFLSMRLVCRHLSQLFDDGLGVTVTTSLI
jgi:hypothetical protein